MEATIDTLRINMQGLRSEMETASRKTLSMEEKVHALNADVAQWDKAKSRVLYALPKVKEFIHRATWALGTPERKMLADLFKTHIQPRIPFPEMDHVLQQPENLLKDRQILSGHGVSVYQECKSVSADVQGALRTVQSNASANARKKWVPTVPKASFTNEKMVSVHFPMGRIEVIVHAVTRPFSSALEVAAQLDLVSRRLGDLYRRGAQRATASWRSDSEDGGCLPLLKR